MDATDYSGAMPSLLVDDKGSKERPEIREAKRETLIESRANGAVTHFVERDAVPPIFHIRLSKTERA